MNLAMRIEREPFLGAGHCERGADRRGYANGFKSKRVDTSAGTLALDIPKTAPPSPSTRGASSAAAGRAAR